MPITLTNEENYSLSIAAWLSDDDYDHAPVKGPYFSATGLLKPDRMIVLSKRAKELQRKQKASETIDISRFVPSRLGTAVHSSIERTWDTRYKKALKSLGYPAKLIDRIKVNPDPTTVTPEDIPVYMERRAFKKIGQYTIGGKFDFVGNGTLEDFKSMAVYSYMKADKDEEQILQGSIYKWLNPDIITSDHMLIQQIFTDWSKLDAKIKKKRGYPQQRILKKKLNLLPPEETEKWLTEKLAIITSLDKVPEPELPPCDDKELWRSDPEYRYYKNPEKTKRSTKTSNSYQEVHNRYLKDGSVGIIKEILGQVRRCGYCDAFDLCTQKDEFISQGLLQLP